MIEKLAWKIAWLLPKKVVFFAAIRLISYATTGEYGDTEAPELKAMEAVGRWSKDNWGWT